MIKNNISIFWCFENKFPIQAKLTAIRANIESIVIFSKMDVITNHAAMAINMVLFIKLKPLSNNVFISL